jgi:galactokinase
VTAVVAYAPGRVNLIGDHTDHTGGWCFPMAVDRGVRVAGRRTGTRVRLTSDAVHGALDLAIDFVDLPRVEPEWGGYVAAVIAQLGPRVGLEGRITSTLPEGVGLSSSAALEVAVALALGADPTDPLALARLCQAAEHAARGVPTGLLDQLASIGGVQGCALLLDCTELTSRPIPLPPPEEISWVVIPPAAPRRLAGSGYAARVAELAVAESLVGPLRLATSADVETLEDPTIRARARHVVTENARVHAFAELIAAGDLVAAGRLMNDSHASLSGDFESSTPEIDDLCASLAARRGVLGARITGGGWGGAVVALARPGVLDEYPGALEVVPSEGARLI